MIEKQWIDFRIGPVRTKNPNFMFYFLLSLCLICFIQLISELGHGSGLKVSGKHKIDLIFYYFIYRLGHGLRPLDWDRKGHGGVGPV